MDITSSLELAIWVLVFLLLALFILLVFLNKATRSPKLSHPAAVLPPLYTEGLPVIGNPLAFGKNPVAMVSRAYAECGDIFTIPMAHKRLTFFVGPKAHDVFFRARDDELDQGEVYKFSVPVFGEGVVYDAPLDLRYQQFRIFANALRVDKLQSYVKPMIMEAEQFFKAWGNQGEVDLLDQLSNLIVMTAARCLLGREIREQMFEKVSVLIHDLDQGMQPISVFAPYLPIPAHKKRDQAREAIRAIFQSVIQKRRSEGYQEDDMLGLFMESKYRDGTPISDDEITGLLVAALFAGQHTSSITSTWTGLNLLRNKEMVKRVEQEQNLIIKEFGEELSYDALQRMDDLHRCMKESLRMYPPLIFVLRTVLEERSYNGYTIPVGDYAFVSMSLSGRLPEVFKNPDEWDPDRFAPERAEDMKAPFSYLGFGGGRHGCMGEQFAYLQIKTIWSTMIRTFEMEPVGDLPKINYAAMVVGPEQPCKIRYKRKVQL